MVNKNILTKKYILDLLRANSAIVSGQDISDSLQVSRVALWKQIKSLRELGYDIEGSSTGYKLHETNNTDHLYPWEFDLEQTDFQTFRQVNSTMDIARVNAEKGCKNFATFIAEKQIDGRDLHGSKWISHEGGLYFTTVIRPNTPPAYSYLHTLAATAVICELLQELYNIKAQARWPNDVLIDNKKIAGVLAEMHSIGNSVNWLNLGVGINVNNRTDLNQSCSLEERSGFKQDRRKLLSAFDKRFQSILSDNSSTAIRNYWKKYSGSINRNIILRSASGRELKGKVENIDESGALLIRNKKNGIEQALFGDLYIK